MLINDANLNMMYRGFSTKYRESFDKTPSHWDRVAMRMPSGNREETYGFLGQFPNLREWIGPRQARNLLSSSFTITNRKFESTVEIPRDAIADDRIGLFAPMFAEMGMAAKQHPDELVFGLLASGFTTNCYDGQFFCDVDHPVIDRNGAPINVSNFQGGAGTPWYLLDTARPPHACEAAPADLSGTRTL